VCIRKRVLCVCVRMRVYVNVPGDSETKASTKKKCKLKKNVYLPGDSDGGAGPGVLATLQRDELLPYPVPG